MADIDVGLVWTGNGLAFDGGRPDGPATRFESSGNEGPGPMEAVLLAAAACSAIDVVDVLKKMRVPLASLEVDAEGDRRKDPPRYYTAIRIRFRVGAPAEEGTKVRRAVDLSREKYCSVLHSLRQDIDISTEIELV